MKKHYKRKIAIALSICTILSMGMLTGCDKSTGSTEEMDVQTIDNTVDWEAKEQSTMEILLSTTWENGSKTQYAFNEDGTYTASVADQIHKGQYWLEKKGSRLALALQEEDVSVAVCYDILISTAKEIVLVNDEGDSLTWTPIKPITDQNGNIISFDDYQEEVKILCSHVWNDNVNKTVYTFKENGTFVDEFAGVKFEGNFWFEKQNGKTYLCLQEYTAIKPTMYMFKFEEDGSMTMTDAEDFSEEAFAWTESPVAVEEETTEAAEEKPKTEESAELDDAQQ